VVKGKKRKRVGQNIYIGLHTVGEKQLPDICELKERCTVS
jgi:hypothetical protein